MANAPDVNTCANSQCDAQFKRLGEGRLLVFPIDDPVQWGLPEQTKQKALWLCQNCSATMYVRLDRRNHRVHLVHKARREHHEQSQAA